MHYAEAIGTSFRRMPPVPCIAEWNSFRAWLAANAIHFNVGGGAGATSPTPRFLTETPHRAWPMEHRLNFKALKKLYGWEWDGNEPVRGWLG